MNLITKTGLAAFSVLLLSSCSHQNATQILNDPKQKPEIFNAICADPLLMTELSEKISKSDPAQQAVVSSRELMQTIHSEKHMASMIRNDSTMANTYAVNLMNIASEDSSLRSQLTHAAVQNAVVKADLQKLMHDSGKSANEKKHKESKEKESKKKESKKNEDSPKGKHKKVKHSKKD